MKIKICGLNPTKDVQICIDHKINYLGFVFYEKSPRNVDISDIKVLSSYDKKNSAFVAVTVNPSDEFIKKNIKGIFDFIQLLTQSGIILSFDQSPPPIIFPALTETIDKFFFFSRNDL